MIRRAIGAAFDLEDDHHRRIGDAKRGVYLFYDYDGEPIYVGRTAEKIRARIGRHLTNQRTDAVAMSVLDPFEVAEIEMWPFWHLQDRPFTPEVKLILERAEYTVYEQAIESSQFSAILNGTRSTRERTNQLTTIPTSFDYTQVSLPEP